MQCGSPRRFATVPTVGERGWGSAVDLAWTTAIESGRSDGRLVHDSRSPAGPADPAPLPAELAAAVAERLATNGITSLYSHQAAVWQALARNHVVIASATASGKSLAFNLPVLDALARRPRARALYLYPTKALAQDQAKAILKLRLRAVRLAIYDGDTPREERPLIRRDSNLILSNPDMVNIGLLPHHKRWGDFFARLEYVVIDEAHVYRGVFGSHVANVLRRLRRIASAYGAEPRFICASATIANPRQLAEALVGVPFELIDRDGAPQPGRRIAIWNPPLVDRDSEARRSVLTETADLVASLVRSGARTICFMKSRKGVEMINSHIRERLTASGHPDLAARISPYRAGYTAQQRRALEADLCSGKILAVVATNALELGIDIGDLDAAVCSTFPGTVASLRQMWGRAGRTGEGIAVFIAGEDGLDQFFCRHPEEFLKRPVEAAILDPGNERIQSAHLAAAASELPLGGARDDAVFGGRWEDRAEVLVGRGILARRRGGGFVIRSAANPAAEISLRSASSSVIAIVLEEEGELLGTVEAERAAATVHPGAVYLHLGRSYEVSRLDFESGCAMVKPFDGDWYTQPRSDTEIYIERTEAQRSVLGIELCFGEVAVSDQVIGFQRKRFGDHEAFDYVSLQMPEQNFLTQALWYLLPESMVGPAQFPAAVMLGALHASEHCQIAVLPLIAMCDRWDVGGLSTNLHFQTGRPTIFIYDGYPGGVGIARRGFEMFERLVGDAARLVGECRCEDGCPSCVQSPKCGNLNDHLHKRAAIELMGRMLAAAPADPPSASLTATAR